MTPTESELNAHSHDGSPAVTTQIPTWRDQSSPGRPPGDRAVPGTVVGERYALRSPIGHGGMGTVWRAMDTLLRRDVAVKEVLLPPEMPKSERDALCERTLREARAAAALSHPSVVQVYDVVTDGGRPWIVMELLEARSLADIVIDDGPLAARAVAKIGIAMLGALEVAHAAGVLHRDVKPANVLICADGRCVLTDFGVARLPTESKLTTPGMVLGSPHFISPERAVGGAFGPPSDLFSLGVTLYTAVEGGPPFDRGDPFETMRAVVEESPRPARLAGPLHPVLWGLLEKEPTRRWSVDHARSALRELLGGQLSRSGGTTRHDTDPQTVVTGLAGSTSAGGAAAVFPPAGVAAVEPPMVAPGAIEPAVAGPRAAALAAGGPPPVLRRSGKVGGRAMLDPDEPLTGQLARLLNQADNRAAEAPQAGADDVSRQSEPARRRDGRGRRRAGGTRRAPGRGASMVDDVTRRVRALGEQIRRPQNRSRLVVGAGLLVVLVLAVLAATTGIFGGSIRSPALPRAAGATPSASRAPLFPIQEFKYDRGIVVNVPKGWQKSVAKSYVDFTDPTTGGVRKVRINVEKYSGTAQKYLQQAENWLKKPSNCRPAPYQRVGLREAQLDGKPGAELEYTCGEGDQMRHGIWRAIVVEANAYHFYLTVPDAQFADSKIIFEEMVRSFRLTI